VGGGRKWGTRSIVCLCCPLTVFHPHQITHFLLHAFSHPPKQACRDNPRRGKEWKALHPDQIAAIVKLTATHVRILINLHKAHFEEFDGDRWHISEKGTHLLGGQVSC